MGIDRIGKGGGLPPTGGAGTDGSVGKTSTKFEVERPSATEGSGANAAAVSGANAAQASSPLSLLQRGEISLDGYLDRKVEGATAGLEGLSASELETIKTTLREQLATDPQLVELVRNATGQLPKPPED